MRIKGAITGGISLLISAAILKIFINPGYVMLICGSIIVILVYGWVITRTKISPAWAKRIAVVVIFLFALDAMFSLTEKKWPWLAKAFSDLEIYTSYIVTDWVSPNYDNRAAMDINQFKELRLQAKIEKQRKILKDLTGKILSGQELTASEEKQAEEAEKEINRLQEEKRKQHLGRNKEEKEKAEAANSESSSKKNKNAEENTGSTAPAAAQTEQSQPESKPFAPPLAPAPESSPSPPPKPSELAYFGRDFNIINFAQNRHVFDNGWWRIRLVSMKLINKKAVRLTFSHVGLPRYVTEKTGWFLIAEPDSKTYLFDDQARRYRFISEKGLGTKMTHKGVTYLGGEQWSQNTPIPYSMIFAWDADEALNQISFMSEYTKCLYFNLYSKPPQCEQFEKIPVALGGMALSCDKNIVLTMSDSEANRQSAK